MFLCSSTTTSITISFKHQGVHIIIIKLIAGCNLSSVIFIEVLKLMAVVTG
jgi:hypothetical protein